MSINHLLSESRKSACVIVLTSATAAGAVNAVNAVDAVDAASPQRTHSHTHRHCFALGGQQIRSKEAAVAVAIVRLSGDGQIL